MGPDPPGGAVPEKIPAQGRATAHREADEAEGGGEMGISFAGGSNGLGGIRRDWGLYHEESEYSRAIYYDATDSGTLLTICLEARSLGILAVVGAGGP